MSQRHDDESGCGHACIGAHRGPERKSAYGFGRTYCGACGWSFDTTPEPFDDPAIDGVNVGEPLGYVSRAEYEAQRAFLSKLAGHEVARWHIRDGRFVAQVVAKSMLPIQVEIRMAVTT